MFFYYIGVSLPYFWFLNKYVKRKNNYMFCLAWAHVEIHFSKNKKLELKKMFFDRLGVSIPHFWFLIKYVCENKNIFCILVGVIITFFIVLVTGVQSRKLVLSWVGNVGRSFWAWAEKYWAMVYGGRNRSKIKDFLKCPWKFMREIFLCSKRDNVHDERTL